MRVVRDFQFTDGRASISVRHEDGIRVYLNGILIHDQWTQHSAGTVEVPLFAPAGSWNRITIEYFDSLNAGAFQLGFEDGKTFGGGPWTPNPCPVGDPWRVAVFDPVGYDLLSLMDSDIDYATLRATGCLPDPLAFRGSMVPGPKTLSARFERDVEFVGGMTTFVLNVDDGARVYIDGLRIMDEWTGNSGNRILTTLIPPGTHRVGIDIHNKTANFDISASWSP